MKTEPSKPMECLRCKTIMVLIKEEHLFLGDPGLQVGIVHYTPSRGFPVQIFGCPRCGKLEFFRGDEAANSGENKIAQIACPICGQRYDMDGPYCPVCGLRNPYF